MTTTSTRTVVPDLLREEGRASPLGPWWPATPWAGWTPPASAMPWELLTQGLMLHSTLWLAAAALQARWWSDGVLAASRASGWPIWHEPTEQLA